MLQLSLAGDADERLERRGLGRVHHRVLYFAHFCPGISIRELLAALDVRHQNIQPSLRHLLDEGYLTAQQGSPDARIKRLFTTRKGDKLLEFVSAPQRERVARGYGGVKSRDVQGYFRVMAAMLSQDRRDWAERLTLLDDPSDAVV